MEIVGRDAGKEFLQARLGGTRPQANDALHHLDFQLVLFPDAGLIRDVLGNAHSKAVAPFLSFDSRDKPPEYADTMCILRRPTGMVKRC
jgi:hypothetical protein